MVKYQAVAATTEVNRKHMCFSKGALEGMVRQVKERPIPSYLDHDRRRPIGHVIDARLEERPDGIWQVIVSAVLYETEEELRTYQHLHGPKIEQGCITLQRGTRVLEFTGYRAETCGFDVFLSDNIAGRLFPELVSQEDEDGLLPIASIKTAKNFGFVRKNVIIFYTRLLRRGSYLWNNFNEYLVRHLLDLARQSPLQDVRIALDHDAIGLAKPEGEPIELDYWYGPKFSRDISSICDGVTVHAMAEPHKSMKQTEKTEFFTYARGSLKTFEIEEVSQKSNWTFWKGRRYTACRYLHAIFDKEGAVFTHTDGALRLYTPEQYTVRQQKNLRQYGKNAQRVKTFLINGNLDVDTWIRTVHFYFSGNPLIGEYFGYTEETGPNVASSVESAAAGRAEV